MWLLFSHSCHIIGYIIHGAGVLRWQTPCTRAVMILLKLHLVQNCYIVFDKNCVSSEQYQETFHYPHKDDREQKHV